MFGEDIIRSIKTAAAQGDACAKDAAVDITRPPISLAQMLDLPQARTASRVRQAFGAQLSGILAGSHVLTLAGEMPIEFVMAGDRVITRSGAQTVLQVNVVIAEEVEAVRLRKPEGHVGAGGLGDSFLAPAQRLYMRGKGGTALARMRAPAVRARELVDHVQVHLEKLSAIRVFTLIFAKEQVAYVDGRELVMAV